jgi:hypothetical protein
MRTLLLSGAATLGALALLGAAAARRDAPGNAAAPCAVRGPTPLGRAVTAAERAAVPLAFQGNVVVSVAWADRLTIIDLATGRQRSVASGIDEPHELAVSPDGRWAVAADFGDYLGDFAFSGTELGVYELPSGRLVRRIGLGRHRGPHDILFTTPTRVAVTTQTTRHVVEADVTTGRVLGATETRAKGSHSLAVTADARLAFTANQAEGSLSRLDLANRRFLSRHVVGRGETEGIAVTPDGREVWMGFGDMDAVLVADGRTGAVLDTLAGIDRPDRIAMARTAATSRSPTSPARPCWWPTGARGGCWAPSRGWRAAVSRRSCRTTAPPSSCCWTSASSPWRTWRRGASSRGTPSPAPAPMRRLGVRRGRRPNPGKTMVSCRSRETVGHPGRGRR